MEAHMLSVISHTETARRVVLTSSNHLAQMLTIHLEVVSDIAQ